MSGMTLIFNLFIILNSYIIQDFEVQNSLQDRSQSNTHISPPKEQSEKKATTKKQEYNYAYLNTTSGLSQNSVTSIIKDKHGFMWFGTRGGLNRYDGYTFRHFKPKVNTTDLNSPSIETLYQDKKGNLYIGTQSSGISIYDIEKEKFIKNPKFNRLPNRILTFHEDDQNNIWMGGWNGGLWRYNPEKDSLTHFLGEKTVSSIVQTADGTIWCGTYGGLHKIKNGIISIVGKSRRAITGLLLDKKHPYLWIVGWGAHLIRYDSNKGTFKKFKIRIDDKKLTGHTFSLIQTPAGNLLIGTWGHGLFSFDTTAEVFEYLDITPTNVDFSHLNFDIVLDLYQDKKGDVWVGLGGGGVVRLHERSKFETVSIKNYDKTGKCNVKSIFIDSQQRQWIGTKENGLLSSQDGVTFKKINFETTNKLYNQSKILVKYMYEDKQGNIWASINNDLYIAVPTGAETHILKKAADFFTSPDLAAIRKPNNFIVSKKALWVATQQQGLVYYKRNGNNFSKVRHFKASDSYTKLKSDRITSVFQDKKRRIWISTYKGLYLFKPKESSFTPLSELLGENSDQLCEIILTTYLDKKGNIWFGTPCSLNKVEEIEDGKYKQKIYTRENGLIDDYVNTIVDDEQGNIWISTNKGISRLSHSGDVLNYDTTDGVYCMNLAQAACFKNNNGRLYFGGHKGITSFNPQEIKANESVPEIVFTDFRILNKSVVVNKEGILQQSINDTKAITLSYKEKEFSFEFSALDYRAPHKNQYAYKLKGFDKEWHRIGNRRHISFNNLKPGKYQLKVKGTNSNGVWTSKIKTVDIIVKPPIWETWYAMLGYIAVILLVVSAIVRVRLKQEQLNNQLKIERVYRDKEKQLNEYKLRFFANISHELRTPLTLIIAPLDELMSKDLSTLSSEFIAQKLSLVQKNSDKLHKLVNKLLEFRKADTGKLKLNASSENIVSFVKDITEKFQALANSKGIHFNADFETDLLQVYFDKERLEIILNNLLSNAFKFSGNPGEVKIRVTQTKNEAIIKVSNDGAGIAEKDIKYLFERFYQAKGNHRISSSGIGLDLVKTYIDLHKGNISVESELNGSTIFTLKLLLGKQHLSNDEIVEFSAANTPEKSLISIDTPLIQEQKTTSVNTKHKNAKIVVVEDNEEVRGYLSQLLSNDYLVETADNGVSGFQKILNTKPDLVIADVMMPEMDGFELCQKIKTHDLLMHIPVLLLTAKGSPNDKLFGTKKGADDYLTKPFDPTMLQEKIKFLISSRKKLRDKFSQKVKLEPTQLEISNEDAKFLQKAVDLVEKSIDKLDFDATILAGKMAMSPSTFYRRIKKLTSQTPGEFIKRIKIKRAAQLLEDSNFTVSEIAEMVGYQEPKSFRRNFKEVYDTTPTEFRKSHQTDPNNVDE